MMNLMNTEGSGRGLILGYYPGIRMEGLRKTTEDFSQDSQSLSRDLNPEPPEYEARMLANRPLRSVQLLFIIVLFLS
jgi:hypothetical protein